MSVDYLFRTILLSAHTKHVTTTNIVILHSLTHFLLSVYWQLPCWVFTHNMVQPQTLSFFINYLLSTCLFINIYNSGCSHLHNMIQPHSLSFFHLLTHFPLPVYWHLLCWMLMYHDKSHSLSFTLHSLTLSTACLFRITLLITHIHIT